MASGHALIVVDRLTKKYRDVVALNDVSFSITDGITGILGENGAGKSTAIKILLGLLPATSGTATILGQSASENVAARARVGYMPEHDCLPSQVSAAEFLTHMAEVRGALSRDRWLLDRHEAASEARPGARARSGRGFSR